MDGIGPAFQNIERVDRFLRDLLGPAVDLPGEYGFTSRACGDVARLGNGTNLTPHTTKAAIDYEVDLLVTRHDAWGFMYGMRDFCVDELSRSGIGLLFAHLPLDAAPFVRPVRSLRIRGRW